MTKHNTVYLNSYLNKNQNLSLNFKESNDFRKYLIELQNTEKKNNYWLIIHDASDPAKSFKEEYIVVNSAEEVLNLWDNNKIPPSNPKDKVWFITIMKFDSRKEAESLGKKLTY